MLALSETDSFWHMVGSNPQLALASGGLGLLVAFLFFKPFFGDWSDFWECIKFCFTPDTVSLFRGEMAEDDWSTMKLLVWGALSVGTAILAFYQLPGWFPHLFHKAL